jgi:tight adherence protein C
MGIWISLCVFLATSLLVLLVFLLLARDDLRARARVRELTEAANGRAAVSRLGDRAGIGVVPARLVAIGNSLLGVNEARQAGLRRRFARAGIYGPNAPSIFLAVKVLLCSFGLAVGLGAGLVHLLPIGRALPAGLVLAGLGLVVPGLWLDARITRWQSALRRGLPDAMDMLVLCLEGGASMTAALQHVTGELRLAHPELGGELEVIQHEMLLGKTAGEAVQMLGQRCDLEEVRSLATVLLQNERYGVSVARALRIHADAMRDQRQQRAEERAQKAAVKILFPTLLCIFPAVFVVVLGPAALRIMEVFARMR